jgi:hypothetical protein
VNGDLERIRQWATANSLLLNASKTQTIIFSRSNRAVTPNPLRLGDDTLVYSESVRNLGLFADRQLNWNVHVGRVVSKVYGALSLLNRFKQSTTRELRLYLVRSLILPIFLYSDVVYFPCLSNSAFNRLQLAFNACTRYVFGLRRYDHISSLDQEILGCQFFTHLESRLASFIHRIFLGPTPVYLSSYLRFGPSPRLRFFITPSPVPSTSLRGNSTIYRGIRLWNSLPSTVKSHRNISRFQAEVRRHLAGLDAAAGTRRGHHHHHQMY